MTSRRSFLRKISGWLAAIAGSLIAVSLLRQAVPRLARTIRKSKVGNPNDFPLDMYTYLEDEKVFVYRDHEGISVVSAVCTHLGCIIEKTDDGFQCPCHGSCYNDAGEVISGAASQDLPWFFVERDLDGQLVIDQTRTVGADVKLPLG